MPTLVAGLILSAPAASRPADEKPPIPPDLLAISPPVPDGENAIYYWRRAAQVEVEPDEKLAKVISYAWQPDARRPSDEDAAAVRHWVDRNQEALALLEESLKQPGARWPAMEPKADLPELTVFPLQARVVAADLLAEKGNYEAARELLIGNLQLAKLAQESTAGAFQFILGASARRLAQWAILRLANQTETPESLIRKLLEKLPRLDTETNIYVAALRVNFTFYEYPTFDANQIAESWQTPNGRALIELMYPEPLRRPFRVVTDPGLVSVHPKPFDQAAAIRVEVERHRTYRTNVLGFWTNRVEESQSGKMAAMARVLAGIAPLMETVKDEPLPLNRAAINRARAVYLALNDPIGCILPFNLMTGWGGDRVVFQSRTEREVMRTILASILFERQKGHLPQTLQELVDVKLLPSISWDFFANAPLSYSKERRRVWSAGDDATDNGGKDDPALLWDGLDAVWLIPQRIN